MFEIVYMHLVSEPVVRGTCMEQTQHKGIQRTE